MSSVNFVIVIDFITSPALDIAHGGVGLFHFFNNTSMNSLIGVVTVHTVPHSPPPFFPSTSPLPMAQVLVYLFVFE